MARTVPVHVGYTILSGSGTGPNGDRIDVWIEYKVLEQSIELNRSLVDAYFYACLIAGESSGTYGSNGCYSSFSVNGVSGINLKSNGSYDFRVTTPILMGSFNSYISHNADGTKSISMSGSFTTPSSYITGGNVSGTVALPTIPRATTPGVSNMTMDTETTIDLSSRASASFTHTLKYKVGATTGTIVTKTAATSYAWTPPLSLADQVTAAASGSVEITCETYSGTTLIGTKVVTKAISVPASVVPTISGLDVAVNSANTTVLGWDKFVKGYSTAQLDATAAGVFGSTIQSYAFTVLKGATVKQSATQAGNEWESGILSDYGVDYYFAVTVTDSRGRTAQLTSDAFTVYDYAPPLVGLADVFRCLSDGTKDTVNGTYISAKGTFGYSAVGGDNEITKKIEYRQNGASGWTLGQNSPADDTAYVFGGGAVSVAYAYDILFTVTDLLVGTVTLTLAIRPGFAIMVIRPGGKGLGVGGAADADEFQSYIKALFREDVVFNADKTQKVGTNQIWHAGNFDPADYLPLTGGDVDALTIAGNSIWDEGNFDVEVGTFTPSPVGITVGNGTVETQYIKHGNMVQFSFVFTMGSTSAITGAVRITLPFTPKLAEQMYNGYVLDSGVTRYACFVFGGGTTCHILAFNAAGTYGTYTSFSATVPITWAVGDKIVVNGWFEEDV